MSVLRRLQKGQKVGPWVLVELLLVHQGNCAIWSARRRGAQLDAPANVVLKFKPIDSMIDEMSIVTRMMHKWDCCDKLPVFDVPGASSQADYFGTLKGLGWLAMARYDITLGQLGVGEASLHFRSILRQCLQQLDILHEQYGMVHMDLKTENILVRRRADSDTLEVAITDFGLADHKILLATQRYSEHFNASDWTYVVSRTGAPTITRTIRPRADLEALGIGLGLVMSGLGYDNVFGCVRTTSIEEVMAKRKWEALQGFIPKELHPYFEFLQIHDWDNSIHSMGLTGGLQRLYV